MGAHDVHGTEKRASIPHGCVLVRIPYGPFAPHGYRDLAYPCGSFVSAALAVLEIRHPGQLPSRPGRFWAPVHSPVVRT